MIPTINGMKLNKIGVVGSGQIGPDIALHFAKSLSPFGTKVVVVDVAREALDQGLARIRKKLEKGLQKGVFHREQVDAMLGSLVFTEDYRELKGAELVVEAATENQPVKKKIFGMVEELCAEDAILTSNSSHMEPERIFEDMKNRARCLVTHYFFPAERNMLVELIPHPATPADLMDGMMRFYESIGKIPVQVKSRYGYAVDPIFEGLLLACALIVERGEASVKVVDDVVRKALKQGVGPFTAHNLTGGNPLTRHGLDEMNERISGWFRSPASLNDLVASGQAWETASRGEEIEYDRGTAERIAAEIMGAYFGLSCEILAAGLIGPGDLERAVETGLAMIGPLTLMNRIGLERSLELVKTYAGNNPGFPVPAILVEQEASGTPWKIPVVFRKDYGDVAVVTIKRPRVLNALNDEVINQIEEIFLGVRSDDGISGAVLTGFGKKAFVSGADIKELAALKTPEEGEWMSLRGQKVLNLIENLGKPVICAMNGLAFGGGCEIAMACTARISRKGLKILAGQPEPKLGIIPGYGGTQRFPRWVGLENAWPLLRNANPISSARALEIGLICEEVEGDLLDAAIDLAGKASRGEVKLPAIRKDPIEIPETLPEVDLGHLSVKIDELISKAILDGAGTSLEEGLKIEAKVFGDCLLTEDMRIGMENFIKNGPRVKAEFVNR